MVLALLLPGSWDTNVQSYGTITRSVVFTFQVHGEDNVVTLRRQLDPGHIGFLIGKPVSRSMANLYAAWLSKLSEVGRQVNHGPNIPLKSEDKNTKVRKFYRNIHRYPVSAILLDITDILSGLVPMNRQRLSRSQGFKGKWHHERDYEFATIH
jgi:hypothetical protein